MKEIVREGAERVGTFHRKLNGKIGRRDFRFIIVSDGSSRSGAPFATEERAEFTHAVNTFFSQDIVDPSLGAHVGCNAPQLAHPFTGSAHHLGELLRPHDNQGNQTDERDLKERYAEHAAESSRSLSVGQSISLWQGTTPDPGGFHI